MPTLTINGTQVTVPDGTTVLNAAKQAGIKIPHYCYHPKLPIAGSCRMCLVDIEKMPKLATACSTTVADGMVVVTDSEKVRKAVRGVLELMLIHHPVDCPICDQAGECGLQDYYMEYDLASSRYAMEDKVRKHKHQDIGGMIMLDSERCILCGRCVRFLQSVTKTGEIEICQRGNHSEVGIFPGRPLNNDYTGNLADICPVGALTSKDFRFKCRVWFLSSTKSVCTGCSNGCNVEGHFREETLYRLKPRQNDAVNETWMCDFGRVEYRKANEARILDPVMRQGGSDRKAGWEAALSDVAAKLSAAVAQFGPESVAVVASPQSSNEELFLAKKIATELLKTPNLTCTARTSAEPKADDFLIKADKTPNATGAKLLGIPSDNFDAVMGLVADRKIKAMLLLGNTLGDLSGEQAAALVGNVGYLAAVAAGATPLTDAAQTLLPGVSVFERGGTFTNFAGRVQRFFAGFPPRGNAMSDLDVLLALAGKLGADWKLSGDASVFAALAAAEKAFAGMTYETVGEEGQIAPEGANA